MSPSASLPRRLRPDLSGTSRATLAPDAVAGLTVAALAVPQGMAYAHLAGLPIEMGLFAAALPAVVAALFGSSPYLITGPTQPVALVLGLSVVGPVVAAGGAVPVDTVLQIALGAGLLLAAFGALGLGRASRFLSDSVVTGLVIGVGVLIVLGQLPVIAGLERRHAPVAEYLPSVWPMLVDAFDALLALDPRSLLLGAAVPIVVVALRRLDPRIPAGLIALAAASGLALAFDWSEGPDALATLGGVPLGWPELRAPGFPALGAVGAPALAIALLVSVQSTAAARGLARASERVDPDRELFAQGAANVTASLLGALPTSGSFSRSSLARSAGARSRLAAVVSGLAVFALLPALAPLLPYVPLSALAGLVLLAGLELINTRTLRRAAATRGDAIVLVATLAATLWLDVVQAIYAGLFLSVVLLVRRGARLQMVELLRSGPNRLREIPVDDQTGRAPVVVLHLEGDLNFAVAPELSERLFEIASRGPRVVILRLKRASHLDSTVIEALRRVARALQEEGATVILCGLTQDLYDRLRLTDLAEVLGEDGLLRTGPRLMEGYERALARAREILAPATDDHLFRGDKDPSDEAWTYEI